MYRIDGIDFQLSPESKFKTKDEGEIRYSDYYKKKYGITIKDPNQPLILHITRTEEKLYLIPELMNLTGLNRRDEKRFQDYEECG